MKVKWNNCFFCLNQLQNKTNDDDDYPLNKKMKRLKLIFNYLIGGEGEAEEKLNISENITNQVNLCDKCNDMANMFIKLHLELDVIQMQMVDIIKQVRKVINQSSRYCGDKGVKSQERGDRSKNNYLAETKKGTNNDRRRVLETLDSFQRAVFKAENSVIKNIPCIYLERFSVKSPPSPSSSSPHQQADDKVVKIEAEPSAPLNPDTFEDDNFDDLEPLSPSLDLLKLEPDSTDDLSKSKRRNNIKLKRKLKTPKKPSAVSKGPRKKKRRSCDSCPFSTKSIYKFEFHLGKHEQEASTSKQPFPYSCASCNLSISTKQYSDFHQASHQGRYKVQCDHCMEKVNLFLLTQHMKGHLGKKEDDPSLKLFPCPNCSYCSSHRQKYLAHLRDHHDKSGQYFCDICGIKMADRAKLLNHLYTEHQAIKKLTCNFEDCKMTYFDSFLLWNHQQRHKKQWICEFCGKASTSLSALKVHERNHTGECPYPCTQSQCSEAFKTKPDLNRHLINKHSSGEKSQCQFCDKQYKDPVSLQYHMRIHNDTTFPCDKCGQAFVSKYQLKRHLNSHSTERNFPCKLCGKAYRTKGTLAIHMKTHTGTLRFKCSYCSKAFRINQHLIAHLRTHTGERPFICDICGSSFSQAGPLNNHKKKHL